MVPMEQLLDTDTTSFSYTFTGLGLGYMLGATICGATFDHYNRELQFTLAAMLVGLSTALAPFTGHLYGYMAAICLQSVGMGYIDAGGYS